MCWERSQRSHESMPIHFEPVHLCHVLRGGILGYSFEQRVKHSIHVLASVDGLKSTMFDSSQGEHHREGRVPITVIVRKRPQINVVILEARIYGAR